MLVRGVCTTCRGCTHCDWRTWGTCRVMPPRRWAARDLGQPAARHRMGWAAMLTPLPCLAAQILLGHGRYSWTVLLQLAGPDASHCMCMVVSCTACCTPAIKGCYKACTRSNTCADSILFQPDEVVPGPFLCDRTPKPRGQRPSGWCGWRNSCQKQQQPKRYGTQRWRRRRQMAIR